MRRFIPLIFLFASLLTFLIFHQSPPVMPVDDTYIHFQYAKQLALGQPYVYNPGLPATSGATSFIYPYILAIGYRLGFQGLSLGTWAMLVGAAALFGAGWTVYKLVETPPPSPLPVDKEREKESINKSYGNWLIGLLMALAFMLNGAVLWHFMSGMETGLMILFTLTTLYTFTTRKIRWFALSAALLALTRPEGSIMAVIAAVIWGLDDWRCKRPVPFVWLALPVLALGVQPTVNLILTDSASASGNQAKSLFGMIPFYPDRVLERIFQNFVQMWREFFTGVTDIWYLPPLLAVLSLFGLWHIWKRDKALTLMLVLWLLVVSAAISTLDTATWHFKRYQMPLIALFYPLAASGLFQVVKWLKNGRDKSRPYDVSIKTGLIASTTSQTDSGKPQSFFKLISPSPFTGRGLGGGVILILLLLFSLYTASHFHAYYRLNVQNVQVQPLAMAEWLRENTPPDSTVAVHDVGMMRYIGERTTIDMVGLTTAGAADYWRNGPGSVAEFLDQHRPDYVAAYTSARGLNYLAATGIYGEALATFTADYDPRYNVALGEPFQGIYRTNWSAVKDTLQQPSSIRYVEGFTLVDQIDAADLASESVHNYKWREVNRWEGFTTEVYQHDYFDCVSESCTVLDGGRRFDGEESFTVTTRPAEDLILITRLHPASAATFDVYANDTRIATRWIPAAPGHWLEIATLIPADVITGTETSIRIVPNGVYMPYLHWLYQGEYPEMTPDETPVATFGGLTLENLTYSVEGSQLVIKTDWYTDGSATGEGVVFVHVYDDPNQQPIVQAQDRRLLNNTLLPGNTLPGVFSDTFVVDLTQIEGNDYQLAIGIYDPITGARIMPQALDESVQVDQNNRRLFLTLDDR